jgi:hypothetical protein
MSGFALILKEKNRHHIKGFAKHGVTEPNLDWQLLTIRIIWRDENKKDFVFLIVATLQSSVPDP